MREHKLLYDKQKHTTDTYTYQINSGGELGVKETGIITIVSIDGKFDHVKFGFAAPYSRNGWRILAAIEKEIESISQAQSNNE